MVRRELTDASITLNHIDGARVRVGLFKTPGSEESFKAIPVLTMSTLLRQQTGY